MDHKPAPTSQKTQAQFITKLLDCQDQFGEHGSDHAYDFVGHVFRTNKGPYFQHTGKTHREKKIRVLRFLLREIYGCWWDDFAGIWVFKHSDAIHWMDDGKAWTFPNCTYIADHTGVESSFVIRTMKKFRETGLLEYVYMSRHKAYVDGLLSREINIDYTQTPGAPENIGYRLGRGYLVTPNLDKIQKEILYVGGRENWPRPERPEQTNWWKAYESTLVKTLSVYGAEGNSSKTFEPVTPVPAHHQHDVGMQQSKECYDLCMEGRTQTSIHIHFVNPKEMRKRIATQSGEARAEARKEVERWFKVNLKDIFQEKVWGAPDAGVEPQVLKCEGENRLHLYVAEYRRRWFLRDLGLLGKGLFQRNRSGVIGIDQFTLQPDHLFYEDKLSCRTLISNTSASEASLSIKGRHHVFLPRGMGIMPATRNQQGLDYIHEIPYSYNPDRAKWVQMGKDPLPGSSSLRGDIDPLSIPELKTFIHGLQNSVDPVAKEDALWDKGKRPPAYILRKRYAQCLELADTLPMFSATRPDSDGDMLTPYNMQRIDAWNPDTRKAFRRAVYVHGMRPEHLKMWHALINETGFAAHPVYRHLDMRVLFTAGHYRNNWVTPFSFFHGFRKQRDAILTRTVALIGIAVEYLGLLEYSSELAKPSHLTRVKRLSENLWDHVHLLSRETVLAMGRVALNLVPVFRPGEVLDTLRCSLLPRTFTEAEVAGHPDNNYREKFSRLPYWYTDYTEFDVWR